VNTLLHEQIHWDFILNGMVHEREGRIIILFGQMISSHGMIKADMVIFFLFTFVIGLLERLNLNGTRQPQLA
jgi:hypothetical protein